LSAHVAERLGLFLDGELPADERAAIASHLRECAACARRLEELTAVDDLARSLTVEAPQGYFDDFPSRVRSRLRAPAKARLRPPVWSFAAAAALLLGVLTPIVWHQMQTPVVPAKSDAAPPPAAEPAAPQTQAGTPLTPPASVVAEEPLRLQAEEAKAAVKDTQTPPMLKKRAQAPQQAAAPRAKEELELRRDAPEPAASARAVGGAPEDSSEADALRVQSPAPARPAERPAAGASSALRQEGHAAGRVTANAAPAAGAAELRYRALLARKASTVAEARALREDWSAYAQSDPAGPHADEARVYQIEAGAAAYRLSGDADDRAALERAAADYLARSDARQAGRVRALLASALPN
jgi:Putative zinc-finger